MNIRTSQRKIEQPQPQIIEEPQQIIQKTPQEEVVEQQRVDTDMKEEISFPIKQDLIIQTNSYFRDYLETEYQLQNMRFKFQREGKVLRKTTAVNSNEICKLKVNKKNFQNSERLIDDGQTFFQGNTNEIQQIKDINNEYSSKNLQESDKFMKLDGIYEDDEQINMKGENINRFSQRFLRNNELRYWQEDGRLVHERDVLEEKLMNVNNIEISNNDSMNLLERNSIYSKRTNQRKETFYKLDIIIQKIFFSNHPIFNNEERLIQQLKQMLYQYRQKVDLALIPHLKQSIRLISYEIDNLVKQNQQDKQEINLLYTIHQKCVNDLENEIKETQMLMENIYNKWEQVKSQRQKQKQNTQPYKLQVRKYISVDGTNEIEFQLDQQDVTQPPQKEQLVKLVLSINNFKVAESRWVTLDWPNFDIILGEKFSVILYSKPSLIKVELFKKGKLFNTKICENYLKVPGRDTETLTSSELIQGDQYFKYGNQINKTVDRKPTMQTANNNPQSQELIKDIQSVENQQLIENQNQNNEQISQQQQSIDNSNKQQEQEKQYEYEGRILYKAQWYGYGPRLPPKNFEQVITKDHQQELIDSQFKSKNNFFSSFLNLNDPRNDILYKKEKKSQYQEYYQQDLNMPLSDQISIRQELMKLRKYDLEMAKFKIPLTEPEITQSYQLKRMYFKKFVDEQIIIKMINDKIDNQINYDQQNIVEKYPQKQETLNRLMTLKKTINEKLSIQGIQQIDMNNLKQIVKEFYFGETENPIVAFVKAIFKERTKLAYKVVKSEKKDVSQVKQIHVVMNLIKGSNFPIRQDSFEQIKALRQFGGQMGLAQSQMYNNGQNPGFQQYNNNFNQYGNQNQGGMMTGQQQEMIAQSNMMRQQQGMMGNQLGSNIMNLQISQRGQFENKIAAEELQRVQGIVQIKFIKKNKIEFKVESSVQEGAFPEFNELFKLLLIDENMINLKNIMSDQNRLLISIFDQLHSVKNESINKNIFILQIQKHFLGQFEIPLSNLMYNQKMSGMFRVNRPLILFQYFTSESKLFDDKSGTSNNIKNIFQKITNPQKPTLINMNINLEPTLNIEKTYKNDEFVNSSENNNLTYYAQQWLSALNNNPKIKNRNFCVFGTDIYQKSYLLCRFLRSIQPPFKIDSEQIYQKVARFVSLIPLRHQSNELGTLQPCYLSCQQFIDLRCGDIDEHAILLTNYFNYIDNEKQNSYKSYLVFGNSIPYGKTAFVLRKQMSITNSQDIEIWDPALGECYKFNQQELKSTLLCCQVNIMNYTKQISSQDIFCNLVEIGCIVSNDNIYANIQNNSSPVQINWNITDTKCWKVLLNPNIVNKYMSGKIESFQDVSLEYEVAPDDYIQRLEINLTEYIKNQIMSSRLEGTRALLTTFNEEASLAINSSVLLNLESFKYLIKASGQSNQESQQYQQAIQRLQEITDNLNQTIIETLNNQNKRIYGFPLNTTYTNEENLWQLVKDTEIDQILKNNIEFIVSLKCFQYPNFIISVWIFVAVLVDLD